MTRAGVGDYETLIRCDRAAMARAAKRRAARKAAGWLISREEAVAVRREELRLSLTETIMGKLEPWNSRVVPRAGTSPGMGWE